jgi:predicted ATPase
MASSSRRSLTPGVGKSRLFFEFKATSQAGCMVLEAYSVSHGKASAYLPVIELLKGYFEIISEDEGRKRREKITGKVLTHDRALEDILPYLFVLLDVEGGDDSIAQSDPQLRRRRTLDAVKRVLVRESLNQPLIVIFEDLHWIDTETQALLNLLSRRSRLCRFSCWSTTAPSISIRGAARATIASSGSTRCARRAPKRC